MSEWINLSDDETGELGVTRLPTQRPSVPAVIELHGDYLRWSVSSPPEAPSPQAAPRPIRLGWTECQLYVFVFDLLGVFCHETILTWQDADAYTLRVTS